MSHSTVVVFFIVLVGIYITHGQVFCRDKTGICMNSLANPPFPQCCPIERDCPECPKINKKGKTTQPCCIDCQQDWINDTCHELVPGSVSQYYSSESPCCPDMLEVVKPFEASPCRCCLKCERKPMCWRRRGFCVTEEDPNKNVTYCRDTLLWKTNRNWCEGDGCFCCFPPKK